MAAEVVHDEVDRSGMGVLACQLSHDLGELKPGTIRRRERVMPAGLRFHSTENIGCAAPFIFVVPAGFPPWFSWYRRTYVGMQSDWLLIQTDHRFGRIVGLLVGCHHVFHLADVLVIQVGHAPHFFPATA